MQKGTHLVLWVDSKEKHEGHQELLLHIFKQ